MTSRRDLAFLALAFALGVAACLVRDPWTMPLTADNQGYYFIAERAASGVPPHVSQFDSKHQLGMWLSGGGIVLARWLGAGDVAGARWASIAATACAVALAWAAGRGMARSRLAGHVAARVMLGNEGFLTMGAMGARPKTFLVPFALATTLLMARRRPGWAGAAAGATFLCWQPAALVGLAAAAVLAASPDRWRSLVRFTGGVLVPVLIYHGVFAAYGALGEELDQAYRFPALFMSETPSSLAYRARAFFRLAAGLSLRSLEPLGLVAVLTTVAVSLLRRPREIGARLRQALREQPGLAHALLAGAATAAFSLYEFQTYIDGFLALPFAAVVLGWGAAVLVARLARGRAPRWQAALAAAAVLLFALRAVLQPPAAVRGPTLEDQQSLAREIDPWLEEGRGVWAVGCTHLLAFRRMDNHVPYGFFFRGMEAYLADRYGTQGYRPRREGDGRMPDVVLVSKRFLPGGRDWLEREYSREPIASFDAQGVRVWRRRGGPGASYSR